MRGAALHAALSTAAVAAAYDEFLRQETRNV
jgi:hypothetical protein